VISIDGVKVSTEQDAKTLFFFFFITLKPRVE